MYLEYMTRNKIDEIKSDFKHYANYYVQNDKEWFQEELAKNGELKESSIQCDEFILDDKTQNYNISDLKNIKILYDALKDRITLDMASDERLWAGLSHGYLWDYIQYRRYKEFRVKDEEKALKNVKTSYFYTYGPRRSVIVHPVARLWWAGYLTYDEKNPQNPYALTDFIFSRAFASNLVIFGSSNFTADKKISLGILKALKERHDKGERLKREHIVQATKYLNGIGSVTLLDALDEEDIKRLVTKRLNELFGEK